MPQRQPVNPAAHTMAQHATLEQSVNACSAELVRYALAILGAVACYLVLISL